MCEYNIPESEESLFEQKEAEYSIIDYAIKDMDNIESLRFFLDNVGVSPENIEEDYGTQCVIKNPKYSYKIIIDSGGLGDFYSHGFSVTVL